MTDHAAFDGRLALRALAVQLVAVVVVFALLALTLPHSFFEDWGILAGPAAWIACAAATASVLALPLTRTLGVAAAGGLLGGLAGVAIGHDLGIVVGLGAFAVLAGVLLRPSRSRG